MSTTTVTFNSTTTWQCPAGVNLIAVQCWGHGGDGRVGYDPGTRGGSGGGGGAHASRMLVVTGAPTVKVTPGQTYNITIPTDANPTVFIAGDSTTIADYGRSGTNGVGGVGGTEANSTGDQKSAGGAGLGYGSPVSSYGGPGGGAGGGWDIWLDGNNGAGYIGGTGGEDGGGAGGDGGAGNGKNGVAPGGGGGGAEYGFLTKGTGAPGRIVLSWETPVNISVCTTQ